MEKTPIKSDDEAPSADAVLPRTLASREIRFHGLDLAVVEGGADGKYFVAAFADPNEAAAFILASNHFGRPVQGVRYDSAREDGGGVSDGADGAGGGCSGEARESGTPGGSGSTLLLS